jgi:outer membrane cobalamin receptor
MVVAPRQYFHLFIAVCFTVPASFVLASGMASALEEIIVTANKRESSLMETAAPMTVMRSRRSVFANGPIS